MIRKCIDQTFCSPINFKRGLGSFPKVPTLASFSSKNISMGLLKKVMARFAEVRLWRPPAIGYQVTISLLKDCVRFNSIKSLPFAVVLDSDKGRRCHHSSSSQYELDRHPQTSRRSSHCWTLQDLPFAFSGRFAAAFIRWAGSSTSTWSVCNCLRSNWNENVCEESHVNVRWK